MLLELHCICNSHHRAVVGNKTSLEQHSDAKKRLVLFTMVSIHTGGLNSPV